MICTDDNDYLWRIQHAGGRILRILGSQIVHATLWTSPANHVIAFAVQSFLIDPRVVGLKKHYLAR